MADIEKVKQTLKYCADKPGWKCDRECLYSQNGERTAGTCWVNLNMDALSVIEELQAENERLKAQPTIIETDSYKYVFAKTVPTNGSEIDWLHHDSVTKTEEPQEVR